MNSKIFGGIIVFSIIFGMTIISQIVTVPEASASVARSDSVSLRTQSKIDNIVSQLKKGRGNYASIELWNQYINKKALQIKDINKKYPQYNNILTLLLKRIEALKEKTIVGDALPPLPFCAQPPMPTCPPGMSCIQAFPPAKTYRNYVDWQKDRSTYLYEGACKGGQCPTYDAPLPGWCKNGTIISGGVDSNGCQLAPRCEAATANLELDIKGEYAVGEKIVITVKNIGKTDYVYDGNSPCGLIYSITNILGKSLILENPMMAYDCVMMIDKRVIKPGEKKIIGTWDQTEWRPIMTFLSTDSMSHMKSPVGDGKYKITVMGVTKDIVIGLNTPQCPEALPPICGAPGVLTSKKDANGCIDYSCEIIPQCPVYAPPPPDWCKNGTIVSSGGKKDSNGCYILPSCKELQFAGMKDSYKVGEKIHISVKNTGTSDYKYSPFCGPGFSVVRSLFGIDPQIINISHPFYPQPCANPPPDLLSTIKPGETVVADTWNQTEFIGTGSNYINSQVTSSGTYLITIFGITTKPIKLINSSFQCPNYMIPPLGWCTNGTIIPGGRDANGCQLPPSCNIR